MAGGERPFSAELETKLLQPGGAGRSGDPPTADPHWPRDSAGRDQDHARDQEPEDDHSGDDPSGDDVAVVAPVRATTAEIGAASLETVRARDGRRHDLTGLNASATTCARCR